MQDTKEIHQLIKQHDKLGIRLSSNANHYLPADLLQKLLHPHRLTFYFFVFMDKGSSNYKVDLQDITLSSGQLLFVLPNQVVTPPPIKDDLEYFKVGFDENTLALLPQQFPFLVNPLNTQTIPVGDDAKQRIRKVFEILNQLLHTEGKHDVDTEVILAHLNTLLTEFNSAYFKGKTQDNISSLKLSKYIEFKLAVETHLTEQHSVNTIAEQLAITPSSLYGIVKEFSGISPKEFITNRLITEAQRKLHYSKRSVKELAYELGFNDPDYFSRLFKKSTGKSVSEFLAEQQDLSGK
ncbi:helix-turn-helix domain-containing protein [Parapedobacter koreensis]|uniref:AraC-type DNA-binding protein n=1 Tax=Parapedobacter koreensis TaxID=332977 RepID=A0A1H7TUA0_9SPHI|nr:AraC family transcriptional regulator [Parapedobacter koreensis]SEL88311.1 AraC-type DNA-binding protein [Parapedobacter koreensis]